jgi:hypothetical protein
MIRKSGNRFSEKIMLKQRDEIMMHNRIMIHDLSMTDKTGHRFSVMMLGHRIVRSRNAHAGRQ